MVEVQGAPDPFAQARPGLAPGAVTDSLVPRLEVMQAGRQQERVRGCDQQVVELAVNLLGEPLGLGLVDYRPLPVFERATDARVEHDEARATEVAVKAPAHPVLAS